MIAELEFFFLYGDGKILQMIAEQGICFLYGDLKIPRSYTSLRLEWLQMIEYASFRLYFI